MTPLFQDLPEAGPKSPCALWQKEPFENMTLDRPSMRPDQRFACCTIPALGRVGT